MDAAQCMGITIAAAWLLCLWALRTTMHLSNEVVKLTDYMDNLRSELG